MELNEHQRRAARSADPRLVVAAGPGTGKTRTLAHRIAHLLRERRVPASGILAVTFTRSAALEMRARVGSLLGGGPEARDPDALWIDTFHAAALRILKEVEYPFGPGADFSVIAEEDKPALLEGVVERRGVSALLEEVRRVKRDLSLPKEGPGAEYQRRLQAARRLDFDDLFVFACRLFDERPAILARYRERLRHVMVDEFQDTSPAQYALLKRLAPENLCVIGDPDQSIYGFTGAAPPAAARADSTNSIAGPAFEPFESFRRDFPEAGVLPLSENYRSQAVILQAALQVIAANRARLPRELEARLKRGLPVEIGAHGTERQEAEMIARNIEGLLGGSSHFAIDSSWARKEEESYAYGLGDIAVLYRFHAQARLIEKALDRAGLPQRTFGKKGRKGAAQVSAAEDLEDFRTSDLGAPQAFEAKAERVTLMTLHRAKGLEFPVVFIAGCEDGVLPWTGGDPDEERRLFYVGMTRAKDRLFLSYAAKRFLFGKTLEGGPSPFVRDIEEELRTLRDRERPKKRKPADKQQTLFDM